jgi:PTS system mannose-specific IID component
MRGATQSLFRLLTIQAAWTYERMGGIGVAHALGPLLREAVPAERRTGAFIRAAEFFNSHPWLAGLAVGAEARAERDGIPAGQIQRLRAALGGPLGALGDRVIWTGLFPALVGLGILGGGLLGWWVPLAMAGVALVVRWEVTRWALRRGLESGMQVAGVLKDCALSRAAAPLGVLATLAAGMAATYVAHGGSLRVAPRVAPWVVAAIAAAGLLLILKVGARLPSQRLGLIVGVLVLFLWQVITR